MPIRHNTLSDVDVKFYFYQTQHIVRRWRQSLFLSDTAHCPTLTSNSISIRHSTLSDFDVKFYFYQTQHTVRRWRQSLSALRQCLVVHGGALRCLGNGVSNVLDSWYLTGIDVFLISNAQSIPKVMPGRSTLPRVSLCLMRIGKWSWVNQEGRN